MGNYRVEGKWIDDLWSEHKLSNAVYIQYAELVRVDFPKRRTWHDAIVSQIRTRKLEAEVARRDEVLGRSFEAWRDIPEVSAWKLTYSELRSRYNMLVLRAGSKSGKTEFAKGLFANVWEQVIEDLPAPNFRNFDTDRFDAILLDNVNSASFLLENRGLLMARNTVHHLAQTATGLFTYPCCLHQVPIIITMDVEKPWPESNWLEANCVLVTLPAGERFYMSADEAQQQSSSSAAPPQQPGDAQPLAQQRDLDCFRLLHNWSARQKLPLEVVFDSGGSRHAETWRCRLQVGGRSWVSGEERSKKVARKAAALLAWTAVEAEALV